MKIEIDFETEKCDTHYYTQEGKTKKKVSVSITETGKKNIVPVVNAFKDQLKPDLSIGEIETFAKDIREAINKEIATIEQKRKEK